MLIYIVATLPPLHLLTILPLAAQYRYRMYVREYHLRTVNCCLKKDEEVLNDVQIISEVK